MEDFLIERICEICVEEAIHKWRPATEALPMSPLLSQYLYKISLDRQTMMNPQPRGPVAEQACAAPGEMCSFGPVAPGTKNWMKSPRARLEGLRAAVPVLSLRARKSRLMALTINQHRQWAIFQDSFLRPALLV